MSEHLVIISVCCNNPDNGNDMGRCDGIEIGDVLSFESVYADAPICTFRYYPDRHQVRLGRRVFAVKGYQSWFGSWCWDAFWVDLWTMNEIMAHLEGMRERLSLKEGESKLFERWEAGKTIRFVEKTPTNKGEGDHNDER